MIRRPPSRPANLRFTRALVASLLTLAASWFPASAADWNRYRGPHSDGVYPDPIRTNWTAVPPKLLWRVPLPAALSSFSVSGGRLFTQGLRLVGSSSREFVLALDAASGRELWAVNVDRASYPNGGVGADDGPRSTPVIEGDRVFVLTSYLKLYCLDAATGRELWKRDFPAELGSEVIPWQNAASPLIWGDLVLVNANATPDRFLAVRQSDGTTAWRAQDETMTQATPILADVAGQTQAIFFTQSGLVAVRPQDGELLWRFPFPYSTSTAASPVTGGDIVFCAAGYNRGSGAVRLRPEGNGIATTSLYSVRGANQIHWASPIHHEGYIYGVFGNTSLRLDCLNVTNGVAQPQWRAMDNAGAANYVGYGSVLKAGGQLLVLTEFGRLSLVELNPSAFHEITVFQAFNPNSKCWNNGAIQDGILYARSTLEAAAFDLSLPRPAAPLTLASGSIPTPGTLRLIVATTDNSPIDAARLSRVRLLTSADLALAGSTWADSGLTGTLDAGQGVFEQPLTDTEGPHFFMVRENP